MGQNPFCFEKNIDCRSFSDVFEFEKYRQLSACLIPTQIQMMVGINGYPWSLVGLHNFVLPMSVIAGGSDGTDTDYRESPSAKSETLRRVWKMASKTAHKIAGFLIIVLMSACALLGAGWLFAALGDAAIFPGVVLWLGCLWVVYWVSGWIF